MQRYRRILVPGPTSTISDSALFSRCGLVPLRDKTLAVLRLRWGPGRLGQDQCRNQEKRHDGLGSRA